jgi:hypothetical protein
MEDAVYFVREPPIARIDGSNVYVEVVTGGRTFRFEGPVSTFLATFAHFGSVASEWRAKRQYSILEGGNVTQLRS